MAKVFLSYAREDAPAAKQLAECIGRAGHQVWWDHQIEGGSRFTAEIDRELKNADAVVVIWTQASIESPGYRMRPPRDAIPAGSFRLSWARTSRHWASVNFSRSISGAGTEKPILPRSTH